RPATMARASARAITRRRRALWFIGAASRGTAGRVARHGAHVGGDGDLEELQIARRGLLVVPQPSGDVERLARLEANALAVLELEVDPAAEHVHELPLADVVVPPRRLRHALRPD